VAEDSLAVHCEANVKLKSVTPMLKGKIKRGQGILADRA
jgi:hypothetical protein